GAPPTTPLKAPAPGGPPAPTGAPAPGAGGRPRPPDSRPCAPAGRARSPHRQQDQDKPPVLAPHHHLQPGQCPGVESPLWLPCPPGWHRAPHRPADRRQTLRGGDRVQGGLRLRAADAVASPETTALTVDARGALFPPCPALPLYRGGGLGP